MKKLILVICVLTILMSCKSDSKKTITKETDIDTLFKEYSKVKLSNGKLMRLDSFPSKFIKPRPVDVWLPENFSTERKYAVLYMHDGQMLFDSTSTWNKQEWKVDEWASKLMDEGKVKDFIVVGVWNIRELRNSNYFPEKVYNLLSENDKNAMLETGIEHKWVNTINSDNYLRFLVEELKPLIDETYATRSNKENTFIMGSSRGGLISMYALSEYPEIFSKAACLSTHWIGTYTNIDNGIPEAFFNYMRKHLPDSTRNKLYFDYGTKSLDALYLPYQEIVNKVIKQKGHSKNIEFKGADHSENSWNQRLDVPLTFLLKSE